MGHGGELGDITYTNYLLDEPEFVDAFFSYLNTLNYPVTVYLPHSINLVWMLSFFSKKIKKIIYINEGALTFEFQTIGDKASGKWFPLILIKVFRLIYRFIQDYIPAKKSRVTELLFRIWCHGFSSKKIPSMFSIPPYLVSNKSKFLITDRKLLSSNTHGILILGINLNLESSSILEHDYLWSTILFYDSRLEQLSDEQLISFLKNIQTNKIVVRCRTNSQEQKLIRRLEAGKELAIFPDITMMTRTTGDDVTLEAIHRGCRHFVAHDGSTCQWFINFYASSSDSIRFEAFKVQDDAVIFPYDKKYDPSNLTEYFRDVLS